MYRLIASFATVLGLLPALLLISGSAQAHAILMTSTPAFNAAVIGPHLDIVLKYNSRLDHHRSQLTLTAPDGHKMILPIAPASPVDEIDSAADLPAGAYALRWQVLAVDGHITRGDVFFTVTAK